MKMSKEQREMFKTIEILKEMYLGGAINMEEALLKSMQEGLRLSQLVLSDKEYKCELTY